MTVSAYLKSCLQSAWVNFHEILTNGMHTNKECVYRTGNVLNYNNDKDNPNFNKFYYVLSNFLKYDVQIKLIFQID